MNKNNTQFGQCKFRHQSIYSHRFNVSVCYLYILNRQLISSNKLKELAKNIDQKLLLFTGGGRDHILPYISYMGVCCCKGYGF